VGKHLEFWLERQKKGHHLEDPDVVGRVILNRSRRNRIGCYELESSG
jgi:hypothetical protein